MTDDLVKRLRCGIVEHRKRWSGDTHADLGGSVDYDATTDMLSDAADRIEELEAQRDKTYQALLKVTKIHDEVEAKLAKAVEALGNVVEEYDLFRKDEYERGLSPLDDEIHDAHTTLAELKGEKDE